MKEMYIFASCLLQILSWDYNKEMGKGREESIDDKMAERRTEDLEISSFIPIENCGELRRQEGEARVS